MVGPLPVLAMVGPEGAETAPPNPFTMTASVTGVEGALQPVVTTPIVATPLKVEFQVTVPLVPEPLIVPAPEGDIDQV